MNLSEAIIYQKVANWFFYLVLVELKNKFHKAKVLVQAKLFNNIIKLYLKGVFLLPVNDFYRS